MERGKRKRRHSPIWTVQAKRGSKRLLKKEEETENEHLTALICRDEPYLEARHINDVIGKGLFTKIELEAGEFIGEYKGITLSGRKDIDKIENDSYLYTYVVNGKLYGVDAADEEKSGILRYANDEWRSPNCKMVRKNINGQTHLFLKTVCNIAANQELRYDYNFRYSEWRKKPRLMSDAYISNVTDKPSGFSVESTELTGVKPSAVAVDVSDGSVESTKRPELTGFKPSAVAFDVSDGSVESTKRHKLTGVKPSAVAINLSDGFSVESTERTELTAGVKLSAVAVDLSDGSVESTEHPELIGVKPSAVAIDVSDGSVESTKQPDLTGVKPSAVAFDVSDGSVESTKRPELTGVKPSAFAIDVSDGIVESTKRPELTGVKPSAVAFDVSDGSVESTKRTELTGVNLSAVAFDVSDGSVESTKRPKLTGVTPSADAVDVSDGSVESTKGTELTGVKPSAVAFDVSDGSVESTKRPKLTGVVPSAVAFDVSDRSVETTNRPELIGVKPSAVAVGVSDGGKSDSIGLEWLHYELLRSLAIAKPDTKKAVGLLDAMMAIIPTMDQNTKYQKFLASLEKIRAFKHYRYKTVSCKANQLYNAITTKFKIGGVPPANCKEPDARRGKDLVEEDFYCIESSDKNHIGHSEEEAKTCTIADENMYSEEVSTEKLRNQNQSSSSSSEDEEEGNSDEEERDNSDSDSAYVPDSESSDSESSEIFPLTPPFRVSVACQAHNDLQSEQSESSIPVENSKPVVSTSKDSPKEEPKPYKKPYRFCIFCKEFKSKLSEHIMAAHKCNHRVQEILNLPKDERDEALATFRKEGILEINKQQARQDQPSFHRERSGTGELVKCGSCSGFYSKKYIKRHENFCQSKSDAATNAVSIPVYCLCIDDMKDPSYIEQIQSKFRTDDGGKLCATDSTLNLIGQRLWMRFKGRKDKKEEVRKSVMTNLRRLAGLYMEFQSAKEKMGSLQQQQQGGAIDMFNRANFHYLEEAVDEYTTKEDGIKAGLKLSLYYLLKKASKILKGNYLTLDQDDLAAGIDKFVAVLELNYDAIFGDASHALFKQKETKLRLPTNRPLEEDVKKLREHTINTMKSLTSDDLKFLDVHSFTKLRDTVVTRLTLFNARRGGEPSRLAIKNWIDAENNVWLEKQLVDNLDPIDQQLANDLKVGYQGGKGKGLVPVLFPRDTHDSLRKLCDEEIRKDANIPPENSYLFPSIRSMSHVSGWHAVERVCNDVKGLTNPQSLHATSNRHRVSSLFALMDIPVQDRVHIFKHLGHSEEVNTNVYQAPLSLREITVVGKRLQKLDTGLSEATEQPEPVSSTSLAVEPSGLSESTEKPELASGVGVESSGLSDSRSESTEIISNVGAEPCGIPGLSESSEKPGSFSSSSGVAIVPSVRNYTVWRREETEQIAKHFKEYFDGTASKRLPGKGQIRQFLKAHPSFSHNEKITFNKVMNGVTKCEKLAKRRLKESEK